MWTPKQSRPAETTEAQISCVRAAVAKRRVDSDPPPRLPCAACCHVYLLAHAGGLASPSDWVHERRGYVFLTLYAEGPKSHRYTVE